MEHEVEEIMPSIRALTLSRTAVSLVDPFRDDPSCEGYNDAGIDSRVPSSDQESDISDEGVKNTNYFLF
jgi:hypothetical protein